MNTLLQTVSAAKAAKRKARQDSDLCQWQVVPGGKLMACSRTVEEVEAGIYQVRNSQNGAFLERMTVVTDEIVTLPDSATEAMLQHIEKFWASQDRYLAHGLIYKRGILLHGPQGAGKSVAIHTLSVNLINRGGVVLHGEHPGLISLMLQQFRSVEPDRPVIVVLEDIDEIVRCGQETSLLSLLDGHNQVGNVVYIATTNHIEKLAPRIVNRPSRFDVCVAVGYPSYASRLAYLQQIAGRNERSVEWAGLTEGFSIAHLRELVAAVCCMDQDPAAVLLRLRSMAVPPKDVSGFAPAMKTEQVEAEAMKAANSANDKLGAMTGLSGSYHASDIPNDCDLSRVTEQDIDAVLMQGSAR